MKKDYRKKARERYQSVSKEEQKKSNNMVMNVTKIFQKIKNKSLLSIEKNIIEWEKIPHYNYNKLLFWKIITYKAFFDKKYIKGTCQGVLWGSNSEAIIYLKKLI